MTIYSFSEFANYTHIHMYVFFGIFTNELKKKKLEDSNYKLDVSIDGNVAKWILDTPERKISNIFKKTYPYNISFDEKYYFYNDKNEEIVFYNNNCKSWDTIFKFRGYQDHVNIKVRDHNICQKIIKEISDSK